MAALCLSFRLFCFPQTPRFLQKVVLNIPSTKVSTVENIVLVQNIRLSSNDNGEYQPEHRYGTPLVPKKKTVPKPRVILLSPEGNLIQQIVLDEAQQMAKRRNLNLVRIVDVGLKSTLPTYQLMSKTQFVKEEKKAKNEKKLQKESEMKPAKYFIISSKIDKHDLEIKIKKIIHLLKHKYRIQIFISGVDKHTAESMFKSIESGVGKHGVLINKAGKRLGTKLYFDPIIPELVQTNEPKIDKMTEPEPEKIKESPDETREPDPDKTNQL